MSSSIKVLINKSQIPTYKPGLIKSFELVDSDFAFSEGRLVIEGIVVFGNKRYENGLKVKFWLSNPNPIIIPEPVVIFVIYTPVITPYNRSGIINSYDSLEKVITQIETAFGVGTPGIVTLKITLSSALSTISEVINIDLTSSMTFWTDIKGWIYSENGPNLVEDDGKYKVDEPDTYVLLQPI